MGEILFLCILWLLQQVSFASFYQVWACFGLDLLSLASLGEVSLALLQSVSLFFIYFFLNDEPFEFFQGL